MNNLRFKSGDVTATLVRATEAVSEMDATDVLILLYKRKPESKSYLLRVVCSDDVTIETANWLLDKAKDFLIHEEDV